MKVHSVQNIYFDLIFSKGHDTTGSAITFALYSLAAHPDVQVSIE